LVCNYLVQSLRDAKENFEGKKEIKGSFVVLFVPARRLDPEYPGLKDLHPEVNILKVISINVITLAYSQQGGPDTLPCTKASN
jgi:hypothetical protein